MCTDLYNHFSPSQRSFSLLLGRFIVILEEGTTTLQIKNAHRNINSTFSFFKAKIKRWGSKHTPRGFSKKSKKCNLLENMKHKKELKILTQDQGKGIVILTNNSKGKFPETPFPFSSRLTHPSSIT